MAKTLEDFFDNNIGLFVAAFDLDDDGEIVIKDKKKSERVTEVFHKYFLDNLYETLLETVPELSDIYEFQRPMGRGLNPQSHAPMQAPFYHDSNYEPVASTQSPIAQALLNTIASGEAHNYHTLYGNNRYPTDKDGNPDYSQFPQWKGQDNSHAAGRYQFEPATWRYYQKKLDLPDFSPESQDKAALADAQDRYARMVRGGNLLTDLQSGKNIEQIGTILHPEWTSVNSNTFARKFSDNLNTANQNIQSNNNPTQNINDTSDNNPSPKPSPTDNNSNPKGGFTNPSPKPSPTDNNSNPKGGFTNPLAKIPDYNLNPQSNDFLKTNTSGNKSYNIAPPTETKIGNMNVGSLAPNQYANNTSGTMTQDSIGGMRTGSLNTSQPINPNLSNSQNPKINNPTVAPVNPQTPKPNNSVTPMANNRPTTNNGPVTGSGPSGKWSTALGQSDDPGQPSRAQIQQDRARVIPAGYKPPMDSAPVGPNGQQETPNMANRDNAAARASGDTNHLPVMPDNFIFGPGRTAPSGAGTTTPTPMVANPTPPPTPVASATPTTPPIVPVNTEAETTAANNLSDRLASS